MNKDNCFKTGLMLIGLGAGVIGLGASLIAYAKSPVIAG